jgi:hypothetical protein
VQNILFLNVELAGASRKQWALKDQRAIKETQLFVNECCSEL